MHPACGDNLDNDLDGSPDCFDLDCQPFPSCNISSLEDCVGGADEDGDDRIDCQDPDCLDDTASNSINDSFCTPSEICNDLKDNDGDGLLDCDDPSCNGDPNCPEEIFEVCDNGTDDDQDGFIDCDDTECINATNCVIPGFCGDNIKNQASEACDGVDLAAQSCTTQGFASGLLSCNADCTFNTSACVAAPACGNSNIDAGEQCDGANLAGQNCTTRGFAGGNLACSAGCQFDVAACFNVENCVNGLDDDNDGAADCLDSECSAAPNCIIPTHGTCSAPTNIAGNSTSSGNTIGAVSANFSAGVNGCFIGSGQPEDIYIFTMPASATQFLAVDVTSVSADLGLYIRQAADAAQCGNVANEVGCTDIFTGGGTEHLQGTINANTVLHMFVDGCEANCTPANNTSGAYTLTITVQ
jgi:hypothetical protein